MDGRLCERCKGWLNPIRHATAVEVNDYLREKARQKRLAAMKEIPFNLNEIVKVKLTDHGHEILKQQHDELNVMIHARGGKGFGEYQPKVDADGYTTFQLWSLMETFGPYIGMCKDEPFNINIKFVVNESKSVRPTEQTSP